MEGKQIAKKRRRPAFLAALAVAALFCVGRPASAQFLQVAPNGVGDLLIYQYWFTANPDDPTDTRDTLIALINPFGTNPFSPTVPDATFVHFKFREGVNSRDVRDFTICLSRGDVWTASVRPGTTAGTSLLTVGNPGSCDNIVAVNGFTPPPSGPTDDTPAQDVTIPASFGYIEAYAMEPVSRSQAGVISGGGDDRLMGVATPVNVTAGFSSSFNAVAFVGFDGVNETASVLNPTGSGTRPPNAGEGVCSVGVGCNASVTQALAREGGVDKEVLMTRWTAEPTINSSTQLVLTFPGGKQPGTDGVSIHFFDENENVNFSPREVTLPREVNTCTISTNASNNTEIVCSGGTPLEVIGTGGTFRAGWLRIINNAPGPENDALDSLPVTRFPVTGLVFSSFETDNAFDQLFALQWASIRGAGGSGPVTCLLSPPGVGCVAFDISNPTSAPWFLPGQPANIPGIPPGNNTLGALNRTGTSVP
jgi:hypothetical protein